MLSCLCIFVLQDIIHDPGRGAPLAIVRFRDPYKYRKKDQLMVACEGMYCGQFIYCGKRGRVYFVSLSNSSCMESYVKGDMEVNICSLKYFMRVTANG